MAPPNPGCHGPLIPGVRTFMDREFFFQTGLLMAVVWLGACVGSFLNVVIYRMPRGLSVNQPKRSFCPHCERQIPWWRNLPMISWLWLRGRCADCGSPIPFRYWLVEATTALLFLGVWLRFGWPESLVLFVLVAVLVAASFIDLDFFIIPHELNLTGAAAGLLGCALMPQLMGETVWWRGLMWSVIGGVVGLVLLWSVVELGKLAFGRRKVTAQGNQPWKIHQPDEDEPPVFEWGEEQHSWWDLFARKTDRLVVKLSGGRLRLDEREVTATELVVFQDRIEWSDAGGDSGTATLEDLRELQGESDQVVIPREAMGLGDVFLLGMMGTILGWQAVLFIVFAASIAGSALAVAPRLLGRQSWAARIPFGPYLAFGALVWVFTGPEVIDWYLTVGGWRETW